MQGKNHILTKEQPKLYFTYGCHRDEISADRQVRLLQTTNMRHINLPGWRRRSSW